MAKLAVLTVHGIGRTKRGYSRALERGLRRALGEVASRQIVFEEVFYQGVLQPNQERLWALLKPGLRWLFLRDMMLSSFGDAAAILFESSRPDSIYVQSQRKLYEALERARRALPGPAAPVVVIAQSLGGQLVSSYLWDAQRGEGIWSAPPSATQSGEAELEFLQLRTTRLLFTTGCNIPLFLSGLPEIVPIDRPNPDFRWLNFYSPFDPLGWPLAPMYETGRFAALKAPVRIEDVAATVGPPLVAWTPLSHGAYWTSARFLEPAAQLIRELLGHT